MSRRLPWVLVLAIAASAWADGAERLSRLRQGQVLEKGTAVAPRIAGGETQTYRIVLEPNASLHVRLENAANLAIDFRGPDGAALANAWLLGQDIRHLRAISSVSGTYTLSVSADKKRPTAGLIVVIDDLRPATEQDRAQLAAALALRAAEQKRGEGSAASLRAATDQYGSTLALARAAHDSSIESMALIGLGRAHDFLGDKRQAVDEYAQALAIQRTASDFSSQSAVLGYLAMATDVLGNRADAARFAGEALALARKAGNARLEANCLNNLGVLYRNAGEYQASIEPLQQALELYRAAENFSGVANTLSSLGSSFDEIGDKPAALKALSESLAIRRQSGTPRDLGTVLNNIGGLYFSMDELSTARDYLEESLTNRRKAGDAYGESVTLDNLASVLSAQGDFQGAIERSRASLAIARATKARPDEAITLSNLGRLFAALGDYEGALGFYADSITIHRALADRIGEATVLTNQGAAYFFRHEVDRAQASFTEALGLWRAAHDRLGEANALIDIGRVQLSRSQLAEAAESNRTAAELARAVVSPRTQAAAEAGLGTAEAGAARFETAWPHFDTALKLERQIGDRPGEADVLFRLSRAEGAAGRLTAAHDHVAAAIDLAESTRARAAMASADLQMSYFASVQDYFDLDVDLQMRLHASDSAGGWLDRAFETTERGRARGFIDLLVESRVDIREGVDPTLLARERELSARLDAKAERQTRLLSGPHSPAETKVLADDIQALATSRLEVQGEIRRASPRYASVVQPERRSASAIRTDVLDADTSLVEFVLGETRSYAFVASPSGLRSFQLPPRKAIDNAVSAFYTLARTPDRPAEAAAAAGALGKLLLGPIGSGLTSKRLAIVASDSLQYVPFAALADPSSGRPLLRDHEIVFVPSASALAALRVNAASRTPPTRKLVIFADPVFQTDDPRVVQAPATRSPASAPAALTRAIDGLAAQGTSVRLERLIGSRREATAIRALLPAADVTELIDFDANRAGVTGAQIGQFAIVHFATHALLNNERPELSGVVLSLVDRSGAAQDGFVGMGSILNLHLNADLVVLSACQTALGKDIRGEGLVGLTRAFMYAGAPRVLATAWPVDDVATADLMTRFYAGMFGKDHLRPAAALRAAQLAMMQTPRWQSPYYWAPFLFEGEWR